MKKPIREAELAWEVFAAGTREEVRFNALCDVGGRAKVGVVLMELPPNCDTAPAHWHNQEEEHLYVRPAARHCTRAPSGWRSSPARTCASRPASRSRTCRRTRAASRSAT